MDKYIGELRQILDNLSEKNKDAKSDPEKSKNKKEKNKKPKGASKGNPSGGMPSMKRMRQDNSEDMNSSSSDGSPKKQKNLDHFTCMLSESCKGQSSGMKASSLDKQGVAEMIGRLLRENEFNIRILDQQSKQKKASKIEIATPMLCR